jgi:hypothetical protein
VKTPVVCVEISSRFWFALLGEIDPSVAKVTTNVWRLGPQMDSLDPDFTVEENLLVYGVACQSSRTCSLQHESFLQAARIVPSMSLGSNEICASLRQTAFSCSSNPHAKFTQSFSCCSHAWHSWCFLRFALCHRHVHAKAPHARDAISGVSPTFSKK